MTNETIERPEHAALVALDHELEKRRDVIESSAASMIDPDRMRGVVLSAFTRNPELFECDPVSVVRAVVEAAQVGLEPTGAIGGAHLVPRWNSKTKRKEATLVIDYRGLVTLAKRSGEVSRVVARIVREKDEFAYQQGTDEWIRHVPALVPDPGPYTHAYAIAFYRDGTYQSDVMSAAQIELHKDRHAPRNQQRNVVGPWVSDFDEMAKKTVLRRLSKLLPLTIEVRAALAFEDEQEQHAPPPRVDRSVKLRQNLQARLTGVAAEADPMEADPPEAETAPLFDDEEEAGLDAALGVKP